MKKMISLLVVAMMITALLTACTQTNSPATESSDILENPSSGVNSSVPSDSEPEIPEPSMGIEDDIWQMDYETFQSLSNEEQRAFQEKFPTYEDFLGWYNIAKDDYEQENPSIEEDGEGLVDRDDLGAD